MSINFFLSYIKNWSVPVGGRVASIQIYFWGRKVEGWNAPTEAQVPSTKLGLGVWRRCAPKCGSPFGFFVGERVGSNCSLVAVVLTLNGRHGDGRAECANVCSNGNRLCQQNIVDIGSWNQIPMYVS